MGAYLASPICDKDTIAGASKNLAFAASSMQGWRMSQEDAHNAILDFDEKTSLFAVYDGHGGAEIALYCSRHLPDFLKQLDSYREGRYKDALIEAFLKFDALLLEPKVKEILHDLANAKERIDDADEQSDDQSADIRIATGSSVENNHNDELNVEEAHLLKKEAELPIEELRKRYSSSEKQVPSADESSTKTLQKLKELRAAETADSDDANASAAPAATDADVVTHADEENTPADDVLDKKIASTTTNGETSEAAEAKPSSSEPKTTTRRARKPIAAANASKATSLTHHLLSENIDELPDDDEDEDEEDFELGGSEEETSDDEDEDEYEDVETEEEDDDDDEEDDQMESTRAAQIKKLATKSIMAYFSRHKQSKKKHDDDSDEDAKDNDDDEANEEEDDDDDDNEVDLSKVLDMSSDPGSSSGCTAVVTLLHDKQLFVANAGDSRCVVCRGGKAIEMSFDHKPEDPPERSRIEKAGYKVTLDGRVSGGLNLSRAIGDHAYKKTANLPAEEQAITALPDIRTLTLEDQDEFMIIACDGIWNFMSSQDVVDYVHARLDKKTPAEICEELFMHCLAPNTSGDGTGCDNMTAIIVKFNFNQPSAVQTSEALTTQKSTEHSPWPTMFSSATSNKRSLSPEPSPTETSDSSSSKKAKTVGENGTSEVSSPTKAAGVFSFNTAANNNNNSTADPQH